MILKIIFLFVVSVALGTGCSVAYKIGAQRSKHVFDIPFILIFEPLILSVIFLALSLFEGISFDIRVILTALLSGSSTFFAMYCLFKSMGQCSFGVTTVLANLSFVIPIALSLLFLKENVSIWQLIGISVIILVIVLVNGKSNNGKNANEGAKKSIKFPILWAIASCVFNGLINFGAKLNQFYMQGEGVFSFNFYNFMFCALFALIYASIIKIKTRERISISRGIWLPLIILSFACGINFYIQTILPNYVNASVQFTICVGGGILMGVLISHLFYKEKFNWRSIVTILGSSIAITLQIL